MKCSVCEEVSLVPLCEGCQVKMETHFVIKCGTCGSLGHLPRTEINIARLTILLGFDVTSYKLVIGAPNCPECNWSTLDVRENLIH